MCGPEPAHLGGLFISSWSMSVMEIYQQLSQRVVSVRAIAVSHVRWNQQKRHFCQQCNC
jgi:hypothetical protein